MVGACLRNLNNGSGDSEDEGITVQQVPPVCDQHVLADLILPVIDAMAVIIDLLCRKRHEYRKALGRQSAEYVALPDAEGQRSHESVPLLKPQHGQIANVFSCDGHDRFRIVLQLLI